MRLLIATIIVLCTSTQGFSQENKWYSTSGGEAILSWATVDNNGQEGNVVTRFSAFFHFQSLANKDFSDKAGMYTGLTLRNIGFIYDDPNNAAVRKKFRTYNVGIPFGLKFGNLRKSHVFLGYELEIPLHYKEKTFVNEKREERFGVWFSDRTPTVMHSAFIGFRGPAGMSIKFKYYLTSFFNENYTEINDGVSSTPYKGFDANVFYASLSFELFRNTDFRYNNF